MSTPQPDIEFELSLLPVGDVTLPPESLAPADGVDVTVDGTLIMPAELRLTLADPPGGDALPMAWHVDDDGAVRMVTGVWDEESNQIVVTTTEFSGWIPDWLNPVSWVAGVIDLVADSVTGRTDPPGCGQAAPEWAQFVPPIGTGTVHSCFQSNVEPDSGDVRAEVFFKSNRRGFQAVTVPAGAAYTWVEGQPDWIRPSLAWLTGAGTTTNILLPGGMSTSFGFSQPEVTTEAGIAVYTTPGTILMDGAMAALGILAGTDASDIVTVAVAVNSCALNIFGVDMLQGDTTVDFDLDTLFTSLLACSLDTLPGLANPDKATAAIVSLDDAHLLGPAPAGGRGEQIGMLIDSANRLGSIAKRAGNAIDLAGAGVDLWDKVLDNSIGNQPAHLLMAGRGGEAAQGGWTLPEIDGTKEGEIAIRRTSTSGLAWEGLASGKQVVVSDSLPPAPNTIRHPGEPVEITHPDFDRSTSNQLNQDTWVFTGGLANGYFSAADRSVYRSSPGSWHGHKNSQGTILNRSATPDGGVVWIGTLTSEPIELYETESGGWVGYGPPQALYLVPVFASDE